VPVAVDVVGETEDEIRADEAEWARQFRRLARTSKGGCCEAAAEFHAGRAKSMKFTAGWKTIR